MNALGSSVQEYERPITSTATIQVRAKVIALNSLLVKLFSICLLGGLLCLSAMANTDLEGNAPILLPDIGDPASAALSVNEEIEVGKILIAQVQRALPVMNDPELRSYIHSLGNRLIAGGLNSDFPFEFLIIANNTVNAFAMPGGIVAINSGLFILSQSESELASVVAHEISHVSQRHIARSFARQQKMSVVNALALLGTILATVYSPDAGSAALYSTYGALQQSELAYSRAFEQEADRIGMNLLASANLDPYGMPRFFERLNNYAKINQSKPPEFLSTHPLTESRISESNSRASQLAGRRYTESTVQYDYAKARLIAITHNPLSLIEHYEALKEEQDSNINQYILGIALSRAGRNRESLKVLSSIDAEPNARFSVEMAVAQASIIAQQTDQAEQILSRLNDIYPYNEAVYYYMATALIDKGQPLKALEWLDRLQPNPVNPLVETLRAKAAERAGLTWRSHESLAGYYYLRGQYTTALEQLTLARRQPGISANAIAKIDAKITEIKDLREKQTR